MAKARKYKRDNKGRFAATGGTKVKGSGAFSVVKEKLSYNTGSSAGRGPIMMKRSA